MMANNGASSGLVGVGGQARPVPLAVAPRRPACFVVAGRGGRSPVVEYRGEAWQQPEQGLAV